MTRILHAMPSMDTRYGGTVEALIQIINAAEGSGQCHEVISLDSPEAVESFQHPATIHGLGPGRGFYGYSRKLDRWLDEHLKSYDLAVIHGCWQYHGLGVYRACKRHRKPYFQFTHGMLDPWFKKQYPLKHLKKWLYWPWAEYRILKHAERVIFTCEEEQRLAAQSFWLYKVNPLIISLGVAPPDFDFELLKTQWKAHHPDLADKRILLFMSRIHEKKGIELLLEAVRRCDTFELDENERMTLVIAGPCEDENYLQKLQASSKALTLKGFIREVRWMGMVRDAEKWGLLGSAEAFILPSHQENFGMVVAESLACGTPVLLTNKVNIWREVLAQKAGRVESDSVEGILNLLRSWMELTAEARTEYSRNATECYERLFNIRRNAQSLFKTINQTLNK